MGGGERLRQSSNFKVAGRGRGGGGGGGVRLLLFGVVGDFAFIVF